MEVVCHIHEHLINAVHMDILWSKIFQIDMIDSDTIIDIESHSRRCYDKIDTDVSMPVKDALVTRYGRSIPVTVQLPFLRQLFHRTYVRKGANVCSVKFCNLNIFY